MSQTADQSSADHTSGDVPPHRYTPALAQQIELAWQDRWEAEGTFHTPNPVGPLADGFAKVALKLGEYRKLDPGPLEEMIFFDHPSGRARIRMAMDWKAAHLPCGTTESAP